MSTFRGLLLASLFSTELPERLSIAPSLAPSPAAGVQQVESAEEAALLHAEGELSEILVELGAPALVQARVKSPMSLGAKALRKGLAEAEVLDRLAMRAILPEEELCYELQDRLLDRYELVADSYDDYISQPKDNGYQSLHMALRAGPRGEVVEVQVRTADMHAHAEAGGAAHRTYKAMQAASAWST